jgi:hypothetical protein
MSDPYLEALQRMDQGLGQTAKALLEQSRRSGAQDRLILALLALVARDSAEPLRFLDEVRGLALGPIDGSELEIMKEIIENQLAKVEGAIIKAKGGD